MEENFLEFVVRPSAEAFLRSREKIIHHPSFDPYSEELDQLYELLNEGKFGEVVEIKTVNTVLSPRAHLILAYAYKELGMEKESKLESRMGFSILECISLTGEGSKASPYIVTSPRDERDFLDYIQEEFVSQNLIEQDGRAFDRIKTKSGKDIYFDISDPYNWLKNALYDEQE